MRITMQYVLSTTVHIAVGSKWNPQGLVTSVVFLLSGNLETVSYVIVIWTWSCRELCEKHYLTVQGLSQLWPPQEGNQGYIYLDLFLLLPPDGSFPHWLSSTESDRTRGLIVHTNSQIRMEKDDSGYVWADGSCPPHGTTFWESVRNNEKARAKYFALALIG